MAKSAFEKIKAGLEELLPKGYLEKRPAYYTYDNSHGHRLYYFGCADRASPPYRNQREVRAIIDIADDGTLAGVELIDDMPPAPCAHVWIDIRNETVLSGEMCRECKAVRPGNEATTVWFKCPDCGVRYEKGRRHYCD